MPSMHVTYWHEGHHMKAVGSNCMFSVGIVLLQAMEEYQAKLSALESKILSPDEYKKARSKLEAENPTNGNGR